MASKPIAVVVDDNKPFLMYLSILLNRMNLEVLPVSNASEALEISRVTLPQVVTMDMMLPDMDGLEALRAFRNDEDLADLPVIMISSYQDKNRRWEALQLGCIDVLDKPVDLRLLHKAIQNCDLFPGGRRRYLRAPFERVVNLCVLGKMYQAESVTLSAQGIFLRLHEHLPKGCQVNIDLPLLSGEVLPILGTVIYSTGAHGDDTPPPGLAIRFEYLTSGSCELLDEMVVALVLGDIINEQSGPVSG